MNSADIAQIIVALITFAGVAISRLNEGIIGKKPKSPYEPRSSNRILLASIVLFAANLVVFGWRYWEPTPSECLTNLFKSDCSILLPPIFDGGGEITADTTSGNLRIDFNNGQGYSGIVFQFTPALDVRRITHVDVTGTANRDFKIVIEYKVSVGDQFEVVESSEFQSFPGAVGVSTIQIPIKYDDTVDQIAVMFYVKGEASQVIIESIRLSK